MKKRASDKRNRYPVTRSPIHSLLRVYQVLVESDARATLDKRPLEESKEIDDEDDEGQTPRDPVIARIRADDASREATAGEASETLPDFR